jgi:hypothetical protein
LPEICHVDYPASCTKNSRALDKKVFKYVYQSVCAPSSQGVNALLPTQNTPDRTSGLNKVLQYTHTLQSSIKRRIKTQCNMNGKKAPCDIGQSEPAPTSTPSNGVDAHYDLVMDESQTELI